MKKNFSLLPFILTVSFSLMIGTSSAQVKLRSDNMFQVGYSVYTPLTLGSYTFNGYNNGTWAIEHWNGGFNIWKPWPSVNSGNYKMFIKDDNGYVGIGRIPSYKLDVEGDIATSGTLRIGSDQRLKSNIKPLTSCLSNLNKLNGKSYNKSSIPKTFDLKGINDSVKYQTILSESKREKKEASFQFGLLAQEVTTVFPELVSQDSAGYLSVDYIGLIPVIIEALKEHKNVVDAQSLKIKELEGKLSKSSERIGSINIDNVKSSSSIEGETNAFLYDNTPNPFNVSTEIGYFLPQDIKEAALYIFDMQGVSIKKIAIDNNGQGKVTIHASELKPGMYIYSLIADGKEIDTKRMILTE